MSTLRLRSMLLTLSVVCASLSIAAGAAFKDSAPLFQHSFHVHSLNTDTFNAMLDRTNEVWIVDFYAPWCPHCRDFAPELEKIGAHYAESKVVHVAAVDCTKNDAVCTKQEIMAYPAVKVFHIPPTSKVGTKFTQFGRKTRQVVIGWVEDLLEDAEMTSGVDRDKEDAQIKTMKVTTIDEDGKEHVKTIQMSGPSVDPAVLENAAPEPVEPENSLRLKYARLLDAGAAAISTLETSLFAGSSVLEAERYTAAVQWIGALAAAFPMEANRAVFRELLTTVQAREQWEFSQWKQLIAEWKANSLSKTFPNKLLVLRDDDDNDNHNTNTTGGDWSHCTTYTCGLWTLIHTMTVEAASEDCVLKPSEIGAAIRLYLLNFFSCQECAMHFARANPISVIDELAKSDSAGNTAVVVWMWRMHNIVNKVTKKAFWPSLQTCPTCFAEGTETPSMNPAVLRPHEIAAYVTKAYEQRESDLFTMVGIAKQNTSILSVLMGSVTGIYGAALLVLVAVIVIVFGVQRNNSKREHAA